MPIIGDVISSNPMRRAPGATSRMASVSASHAFGELEQQRPVHLLGRDVVGHAFGEAASTRTARRRRR